MHGRGQKKLLVLVRRVHVAGSLCSPSSHLVFMEGQDRLGWQGQFQWAQLVGAWLHVACPHAVRHSHNWQGWLPQCWEPGCNEDNEAGMGP
jgi:hypothetical protein